MISLITMPPSSMVIRAQVFTIEGSYDNDNYDGDFRYSFGKHLENMLNVLNVIITIIKMA